MNSHTRSPLASLLTVLALLFGATPLAFAEPTPTTEPSNVALIVDASDSMSAADVGGGTRMDAAKKASTELIDSLAPGTQLGLVTYGAQESNAPENKAKGCTDVHTVADLATPNKAELVSKINALQPKGYTPIGASLRHASDMLGSKEHRSIILVSDGEDTCAPPPVCEVARELANQATQLVIHTVGLRVQGKAQEDLQCVATATGGTYTSADDTDSLKVALTSAAQRTSTRYEAKGTVLPLTPNPDDAYTAGEGQYVSLVPGGNGAGDRGPTQWFKVNVPEDKVAMVSATVTIPVPWEKSYSPAAPQFNAYLAVENPTCGVKDEHMTGVVSYPGPPLAVFGAFGDKEGCDPSQWRVGITRLGSYHAPRETEILIGFRPKADDDGKIPTSPLSQVPPSDVPLASRPEATPVTGGTSFNSAADVTEGTFKDSAVSGETRFYRIDVPWGKRPIVQFDFDRRRATGNRFVDASVYSPFRVLFDDFKNDTLSPDKPLRITNQAAKYAEPQPRTAYQDRASNVAGSWYIAVNVDGKEDNGHASVEEPFTMSVALEGTEIPGPEWKPNIQPGPAPTKDEAPQEQAPAQSDAAPENAAGTEQSSATDYLPLALGGLAVVTVIGIAVALLASRRR